MFVDIVLLFGLSVAVFIAVWELIQSTKTQRRYRQTLSDISDDLDDIARFCRSKMN